MNWLGHHIKRFTRLLHHDFICRNPRP